MLIFVLWRCSNCRWVKVEVESLIWGQLKMHFSVPESRSESEVSRYSAFIGNCLIISHTRYPYPPSGRVHPLAPGVTKGNEDAA